MDMSVGMGLHPATSKSGDNAYYLDQCGEVGHRPNYAVCLHKIEQRKDGRLPVAWSECSAAIGAKRCPALKLRKEELIEKKAIYFISRQEIQAQAALREADSYEKLATLLETGKVSSRRKNYSTEDFQPARPVSAPYVPKAAPAAKPKTADEIAASGGYAEAITRAAAQPTPKPAMPTPVAKPVAPKPVPAPAGEKRLSPLELARLRMAK